MTILARTGTYYILKVPLVVAEEISHMQADGAEQFSLALRPDQDLRVLDVSAARRDDEPDHRALRPADPGAYPA